MKILFYSHKIYSLFCKAGFNMILPCIYVGVHSFQMDKFRETLPKIRNPLQDLQFGPHLHIPTNPDAVYECELTHLTNCF